MATIRYKRNSIASLTRDDGSVATDHFEKAGILWHSFRERLGISMEIDNSFNISNFLTAVESLDSLADQFTYEEIERLWRLCPMTKRPG
jgi:hypothetical protein